jgi:hypothetical protein
VPDALIAVTPSGTVSMTLTPNAFCVPVLLTVSV